MMSHFRLRLHTLAGAVAALVPVALLGWGADGHRMVNTLALDSLPPDYPAFVQTPAARARISYLSNAPDMWRSSQDLSLRHLEPDHQIDLEELAAVGVTPETLPEFRQVFAAQESAARAAHPEKFLPLDPAKNRDHTAEQLGNLPWAIVEYYGKLRAEFAYLHEFEQLGTPEEIANAQADIIETMGMMGHYVADGAQPLHTTVNYNGWTTPDNPGGFSNSKTIHSWIDSGFIQKVGITAAELRPQLQPATSFNLQAAPGARDPMFSAIMSYLVRSHELVVPLYRLDQEGKFRADGPPGNPEARTFVTQRLLAGAEMLGSIWLTAWRHPEPDAYRHADLLKRRNGGPPPAGATRAPRP